MSSPETDTPPANPPSQPPAAKKAPYTFRGEGTSSFQAFAWNTGRFVSRVLGMLMFRFHARGVSNIPPARKKGGSGGGVLMLTNHQSFLDPWLIGIAPPRQIHSMARDTLYKGGFLHYLMELWNAFPVKRGAADLGAIRTAVERLEAGFVVNIFLEGTRSEDGAIQQIMPGFTLILNRCKADIPLQPVAIDGAFEAWPRHCKFPRPRPIRIYYGKPIEASEWRALAPEQLARRVHEQLVAMQRELGSAHAELSAQRLAALPPPAAGAGARRRRG